MHLSYLGVALIVAYSLFRKVLAEEMQHVDGPPYRSAVDISGSTMQVP